MDSVKKTDETNEALATELSVIRNVSVPVGISTPGQPNIAATQWRTLSDHRKQVYYFESAFSPYLLAVNLVKLDVSEGAPARKLSLTDKSALLVDGNFVFGEVSRYFLPAQPFRILSPTAPAKQRDAPARLSGGLGSGLGAGRAITPIGRESYSHSIINGVCKPLILLYSSSNVAGFVPSDVPPLRVASPRAVSTIDRYLSRTVGTSTMATFRHLSRSIES